MDTESLGWYITELTTRCNSNLKVKGDGDYATKEDRLYSFHAAAPILGSGKEACFAYATKHYVSIAKLLKDGRVVNKDLALEKIGDLVTYMYLLYALLREEEDAGTRSTDQPNA